MPFLLLFVISLYKCSMLAHTQWSHSVVHTQKNLAFAQKTMALLESMGGLQLPSPAGSYAYGFVIKNLLPSDVYIC